jgi:hypothetical protein
MPQHTKLVRGLLKRTAKLKKRIKKTLRKHNQRVDLIKVNSALAMVDREIVRLGRKRVGRKR